VVGVVPFSMCQQQATRRLFDFKPDQPFSRTATLWRVILWLWRTYMFGLSVGHFGQLCRDMRLCTDNIWRVQSSTEFLLPDSDETIVEITVPLVNSTGARLADVQVRVISNVVRQSKHCKLAMNGTALPFSAVRWNYCEIIKFLAAG